MPSPRDGAESQSPLIVAQDAHTAALVRSAIEEEHLRLLAIFHYVVGGFTLLVSCIFLVHIFMGLSLVMTDLKSPSPEAGVVGWIITAVGTAALLGGWLYGGLTLYAGRCLQLRKHRTFIMVMSAINCLQVPLGTLLGGFTIKVLLSPAVIQSFNAPGASRGVAMARTSLPLPDPVHISMQHQLDAEEEAIWAELEKSAARDSAAQASVLEEIEPSQSSADEQTNG